MRTLYLDRDMFPDYYNIHGLIRDSREIDLSNPPHISVWNPFFFSFVGGEHPT